MSLSVEINIRSTHKVQRLYVLKGENPAHADSSSQDVDAVLDSVLASSVETPSSSFMDAGTLSYNNSDKQDNVCKVGSMVSPETKRIGSLPVLYEPFRPVHIPVCTHFRTHIHTHLHIPVHTPMHALPADLLPPLL
eukprot:scpid101593/ scgid13486/ 